MGFVGIDLRVRNICVSSGYTTKKPAQFKLQDDGSAQAVAALAAVHGSSYLS